MEAVTDRGESERLPTTALGADEWEEPPKRAMVGADHRHAGLPALAALAQPGQEPFRRHERVPSPLGERAPFARERLYLADLGD